MVTLARTAAAGRTLGAADLAGAVPATAGAALWPRHILVASSGAPSSAPALAVTRALARRCDASVEMISVFAPSIPLPVSANRADGAVEGADRAQVAQLLKAVRVQRDAIVRSGPVWPLRFESGDPTRIIARVAREKDVDLVVLGIGSPVPRERQCGSITPAVLANDTEVPLYAAATGGEELSRRTIVVLPDAELHLPTIEAAIACTARGGDVWIAAPVAEPDASASPARIRSAPPAADSGSLRLASVTLHPVDLDGELLSAVLALAASVNASLIAVPARGSAGSVRLLLPNYAGPLLLTAGCSVLVVPDLVDEGDAPC